ncbi:Heat shock protein HSP 90-beta [Myotis davidii]|uniref:Heat shock protein HSP 90-beta n=1 Tax=Myotis davidii TaxID=225400 RepID=L5LCI3_MYODS|nr:Heat shock protein HSP 90-beta [Myotis davidii]
MGMQITGGAGLGRNTSCPMGLREAPWRPSPNSSQPPFLGRLGCTPYPRFQANSSLLDRQTHANCIYRMIKLGLGIDEDEVTAEPSAAVPDEIHPPALRVMRMPLAWKK